MLLLLPEEHEVEVQQKAFPTERPLVNSYVRSIEAKILHLSTMPGTVTTPVKRSWAQVVEGDSANAANVQKSVKPAARGSLLRFCKGEVLTMLSHYGWLMVYGDVDHPSVEKHGGDVYIHKDDVVDGSSLCPGDVVSFYLYVDEKGLGAEECRIEQKAAARFNPSAAEFVPMNVKPTLQGGGFSMRPCAQEFVPGGVASKPTLLKSVADVSNDEWTVALMRLSHVFASDDEDDEEYNIGKPFGAKYAPSSDGSTSVGATSDSEDDDIADGGGIEFGEETFLDMPEAFGPGLPPGLPLPPNFRPPPGLGLPLGFDLPPGLSSD